MVLSHLSRLGLQVNREKSKLSPTQRISFLGMELDSVNLTARLSEERAQSMLRCLESLQRKRAVPLKHFQRLLGHMASSAAITPLGLLHMRPLQRWLHDWVPRWAWRHGTYRVSLTPSCRRTFSPWSDLAFLRAGVPLEQVSRHVVVSTDASATGWGAMCNGHAAAGLWTGPQLQWHINFLELLAVWLALRRFRTLLHEKHILVRSDNTATVAYINHQGGLRSRRISPAISSFGVRSIWGRFAPFMSQASSIVQPTSSHVSTPFRENGDSTPRYSSWFGDASGTAQVDLFASPDTSHCQLFFSLSEGTLGTDALACSWPRGLRKYAFPPVSLLAQTCARSGRTRSKSSWWCLTGPIGLGSQNWCSSRQPLLGKFLWGGIYFLREGAPSGTRAQTCGTSTYGPWTGLSGLPPAVVNTITSARALSTRQAYRLKWNLRFRFRFFIIRHIHNHTSIISSEMQVELKKNTAFTWGKWGEKK